MVDLDPHNKRTGNRHSRRSTHWQGLGFGSHVLCSTEQRATRACVRKKQINNTQTSTRQYQQQQQQARRTHTHTLTKYTHSRSRFRMTAQRSDTRAALWSRACAIGGPNSNWTVRSTWKVFQVVHWYNTRCICVCVCVCILRCVVVYLQNTECEWASVRGIEVRNRRRRRASPHKVGANAHATSCARSTSEQTYIQATRWRAQLRARYTITARRASAAPRIRGIDRSRAQQANVRCSRCMFLYTNGMVIVGYYGRTCGIARLQVIHKYIHRVNQY